jgi:hypothetical protein
MCPRAGERFIEDDGEGGPRLRELAGFRHDALDREARLDAADEDAINAYYQRREAEYNLQARARNANCCGATSQLSLM